MGSAAGSKRPREMARRRRASRDSRRCRARTRARRYWPPRIEETKKSVVAGIVVMSSANKVLLWYCTIVTIMQNHRVEYAMPNSFLKILPTYEERRKTSHYCMAPCQLPRFSAKSVCSAVVHQRSLRAADVRCKSVVHGLGGDCRWHGTKESAQVGLERPLLPRRPTSTASTARNFLRET
jgi:hypothetical protein